MTTITLPSAFAGAIFDFAGFLTTRDKVIEVGSTADAAPVADLVNEWLVSRGLSSADADVQSWRSALEQPEPAAQAEPVGWLERDGIYGFLYSLTDAGRALPSGRYAVYTTPAPAQPDHAALLKDAARYRWLRERLLGADFNWAESGESVLVFKWPDGVSVGADCDQNIDAALGGAA